LALARSSASYNLPHCHPHLPHPAIPAHHRQARNKNTQRKVKVNELAEAIHEVLPLLSKNKQGVIPKSVLYRTLLTKGLFHRTQLAPTTFYRMIREHQLLNQTVTQKLRLSFAMQYANELWQADTMHGPSIKQPDGRWRKTFFIAFIDDASRVITHGEFFYRDNAENMIEAFRSALYKRGKPQRLYFDNGSNSSKRTVRSLKPISFPSIPNRGAFRSSSANPVWVSRC
jgi:hypothetical protein